MQEVDALDGLMGRVIDRSGLQFRTLNRSRGPAVYGPRAQADRELYRSHMLKELAGQPNLKIVEAGVDDLLVEDTSIITRPSGGNVKTHRVFGVILENGDILRAGQARRKFQSLSL